MVANSNTANTASTDAHLSELANLLNTSLFSDRRRLGATLKKLAARQASGKLSGQEFETQANSLRQQLLRSTGLAEQRQSAKLQLVYPPELPVVEHREDVLRALSEHQVLVLAGETGSGKTTQLPKLCIEAGCGVFGRIGHTQPRRLAARTVAARLAEEMDVELGGVVGYQFRFQDVFSEQTRIKLMTDGILLAQIARDKDLLEYDTLIIDEAHERSLNIDFLLGYLKRLLPRRPELKLIITSATIDVERISNHFDNAPVVTVSGRNFPVRIEYLDPTGLTGSDDSPVGASGAQADSHVLAGLKSALEQIDLMGDVSVHARDVLVFLPGEREIRETSRSLRDFNTRVELLPLYARLSQKEQNRIFSTAGRSKRRRVILATNVAETSLTVPGIGYVIDAGTARVSRYSARSKLQRLPTEAISRASADQRAGRCGRIAPGTCFRLYSETDYQQRAEFTEPELLRTNLAAVILQMKALNLGDIADFPFLESPEPRQQRAGLKTLQELDALDAQGRVSPLGRKLARIPADPRLGRMLLASTETDCLDDMLVIVSALAVQDPREFPSDKRQAADQQHRRFWHKRSDFMAWLTLWDYLEQLRQSCSHSQFRKRCSKEFLSAVRIREWRDVHRQLKLAIKDVLTNKKDSKTNAPKSIANTRANSNQERVDAVHKRHYENLHTALLTGLLGNIGCKQKKHDYRGARNSTFFINPGSSQFKSTPRWVLAGEILETRRVYARCVAAIEPAWVVRAAGSKVKSEYSEPFWHERRGQVLALRSTSLYGLLLTSKERVVYDQIEPEVCREIFVRQALSTGSFKSKLPFWQHNLEKIAQVHEAEEKLRRRDILIDENRLADFYLQRLDSSINSRRALEKWHRNATVEQRQVLHLGDSDVYLSPVGDDTEAQFPSSLHCGGVDIELRYCFRPGDEADGVTAIVPVVCIGSFAAQTFEWLVPGMLRDKCIDMVKLLPKPIRRQLVPVPQLVDTLLASLAKSADRAESASLYIELARQIEIQRSVKLDTVQWQQLCEESLDDFHRMRFEVVDENGAVLHSGRSLSDLQRRARSRSVETVDRYSAAHFRRQGIRRWDFGKLEESVAYQQDGVKLRGFPMLVDCDTTVTLDLATNPLQAAQSTRQGMLRLLAIAMPDKLRYLRKQLCRDDIAILPFVHFGTREDLVEDLIATTLFHCCLAGREMPRDAEAFADVVRQGRQQSIATASRLEDLLYKTLENYHLVCERLQQRRQHFSLQCADIDAQLDALLGKGFLLRAGEQNLHHYPRYLQAIAIRLDRLSGNAVKDAQLCEKLASLEHPLKTLLYNYPQALFSDPSVARFRWIIEELRVSLFAQQLKTPVPVSIERAVKAWNQINLNQYIPP